MALDDDVEEAAISYMLEHYDDPTCGSNAECRLPVQDGEMMWIVGQNGARLLDLGVRRE